METVKVRLLKRHNGKPAGEIIEVRPGDVKVLKAVGVVEDYVAPRRSAPANRTIQPVTIQPTSAPVAPEVENTETETTSSSSTPEEKTEFGTTQPYSRRDMRPEE